MLFCSLSGLLLFSLVVEATCVATMSVSTVSNNNGKAVLKNLFLVAEKVLISCIGNARQHKSGSCDSGKDVEHT